MTPAANQTSRLALFDSEVMSVVEQDRLLRPDFKRPHARHQQSFMSFLARFLERRPYARRKEIHWNDNSSAFLNHILDACGVTSVSDRLAGFEVLFDLMDLRGASSPTNQDSYDFVLKNLRSWNDLPIYPPGTRWITHLVPAAIALGARHVYVPLLPAQGEERECSDNVVAARLKRSSTVFGTPLYAAVAAADTDIVRQILDFRPELLQRGVPNLLSVAVVAGGQEMVDTLLPYQPPRDTSLRSAILLCAREGYVGRARTLLTYAQDGEKSNAVAPWALQEGLHLASLEGDKDMIRCFLDHGAKLNADPSAAPLPEQEAGRARDGDRTQAGGLLVRPPPLSLAAWAGDGDFMRWLLENGAALNGQFSNLSPILGAILGDQVGTLKTLVELGASGSWEPSSWVLALSLCIEVHANNSFRHLVCEAKVIDIPSIDLDNEDDSGLGSLVEKLCEVGNVEAFDILAEAGMPVDKEFCGTASWTPMMIAQSYDNCEQRSIVGRLEARGIKQYDVTQTAYAQCFESGEWPRRTWYSSSAMPDTMGLIQNDYAAQ